jgi:hypothetical protein
MDKPVLVIEELKNCIIKDFGLEDIALINVTDSAIIKSKLVLIINHLLDHDLNKLISICYRLDLNENIVNEVLTNSPVLEISSSLADIIYDREMQKVQTRLKYRDLN